MSNVIKIGDNWFSTDIIQTSYGIIRIGTMPKISKILNQQGIKCNIVILPPPVVTVAGDNYTGEEFVLWNKIHKDDFTPILYIGEKKYINYLYKKLKENINSTFNDEKTKIIKKNRLKKLFKKRPVRLKDRIKIGGKIEVCITADNIFIYEDGQKIYDWRLNLSKNDVDSEVNKMLARFKKRNKKSIQHIEVIPLGNGNGFREETSNFLIKYGSRVVWVDVMAKPFLALKRLKMSWDEVTDYFISHTHEDHTEGFSAVLKRAIDTNRQINLITTKKIYNDLRKKYKFLFPGFESMVNHINIIPNTTLPYYHGYLSVRLNHHVLKSGTLGMKLNFKNNIVAISGDTKYDSKLALKLKDNTAFDVSWYKDANLIFHEVEFEDRNSVHTYYKEIENIMKSVSGKVVVYHSSSDNFLLEAAKVYYRYIIKDGKVKIKK